VQPWGKARPATHQGHGAAKPDGGRQQRGGASHRLGCERCELGCPSATPNPCHPCTRYFQVRTSTSPASLPLTGTGSVNRHQTPATCKRFTCELAGEPQHRICFLAQTLRPRLRFILLGMEDEGMTCCSASRVPSFSKARWKPDSISAAPDRVCQTIRLLLAEFHTCSSSAPDITRPLPSVSPGIGGCPGRLRSSAFPHSPAPETVDLLSNHRVASTV
jgi:hypothetical protein